MYVSTYLAQLRNQGIACSVMTNSNITEFMKSEYVFMYIELSKYACSNLCIAQSRFSKFKLKHEPWSLILPIGIIYNK